MEDTQKTQIADQLAKAKAVDIYVSSDSGFDGLAAGLALYGSLSKIGKNVCVIAPAPTVGDAQALYSVDRINKGENQKDLIINIPNAIQNVEKVSYTIKDDKLIVKVHSLPESKGIAEDGIIFEKANTASELSFLIGYATDDILETDITHEQINSSNSYKIAVSDRQMSLKSVQTSIQSSDTSSISEMIADLLIQLALPINEDISYNLYSGIKKKTNMFSPDKIKSNTLLLAQSLIKSGAGQAGMAVNNTADNTQKPIPNTDIPAFPQQKIRSEIKQTPASSGSEQTDLDALSKKISAAFNAKNKSEVTEKSPIKSKSLKSPIYEDIPDTPIEKVESKESSKQSWLKPPKIYRGSKSFDRES